MNKMKSKKKSNGPALQKPAQEDSDSYDSMIENGTDEDEDDDDDDDDDAEESGSNSDGDGGDDSMIENGTDEEGDDDDDDAEESGSNNDGDGGDDSYDSMIENGTDEEDDDDDDDDDAEESGNNSDGGDDAAPQQRPTSQAGKRKAAYAETEEAHQKRLKAMKQLYKPPTVEEINRLKETENYYHSNLFRMQTKEMLKEVSIGSKVQRFIDGWLQEFSDFLHTLQDADEARNLLDCEYETVNFPIELPACEEARELLAEQQFRFFSQRNLHVIGSVGAQSTAYGKPITVDLVLEMPEPSFRKEDYRNMRYHLKRAHYLCSVAEELCGRTEGQLASEVKFEYLKGDTLKPVLVITPADQKMARRVSFHLSAVPIGSVFSPKRFSPERNNVRPAMIGGELDDEHGLTATPHYNSSILYDMHVLKNAELLGTLMQADNIREAVVMLKVWCRQRGFDKGRYPFDGGLVTFYVAYLLQTKRIYATMSSYQVIRLVWNQLANSKWDTEGITMEPNAKDSLSQFFTHYDTVFLDSTGRLNLTANLSVDLYRRVRLESAAAITLLNNPKINSFYALFLSKYPMYTQYDHIVVFDKPQVVAATIDAFAEPADQLNYICRPRALFSRMVVKLLHRGLGKRASLIVPIVMNESAPLALGILLDPTESFNLLDKGPEAIDAEASEEFRSFWRGKSELRRFKDGAITESCVWGESTDPIGKKRLITQEIVRYLLNAHLDITRPMVTYAAEQFEKSIVPLPTLDRTEHETIEERTLACIHAFDGISRLLRDLDDLPLTIHAILGTDAVFRYADPDPPRATGTGLLVNGQHVFLSSKVMHATIQLEASGKWPEHLEAIRRLKAAFYLQIVTSLKAKCRTIRGAKPRAQAYADYIDVLHEKYVFRFCIIHQREISIVREQLAQNKVTKLYRDSDESVALELQASILPKLTSILHGLHQQHFSFGSVVSIAKRWLYAQLIDPFLWPDECTELLVAWLYLRQTPIIQPQAGFLRFLHYLATTDWSKELVLLNFNDELSDAVVDELDQRFLHQRDAFPPLAIVTSCDNEKYGLFGRAGPSGHVLNRVSLLAQTAIELLEQKFSSIRKIGKRFFTPSYDGYDLIIHLDGQVIPSIGIRKIADIGKRSFSIIQDMDKEPAAGFYPVQFYLRELREAYDQYAVFFYDPCGGDRIAVLWRPEALEAKPFTTSNASGRQLTDDGQLLLERETLIRDFEILGKGVVERIERKE